MNTKPEVYHHVINIIATKSLAYEAELKKAREKRDMLIEFIKECEIWFSKQPIVFPMQQECNKILNSLSLDEQ